MDAIRTPISFLTEDENNIMEHLNVAMSMYDELCAKDPQSPLDTFNFGHYIEAARNAVLLRGARRMDPDHLMPTHDEKVERQQKHRDYMYSKIEERMDLNQSE